jgi:hypothetical protein
MTMMNFMMRMVQLFGLGLESTTACGLIMSLNIASGVEEDIIIAITTTMIGTIEDTGEMETIITMKGTMVGVDHITIR